MPVCPAPPSLSVSQIFAADPLRVVLVSGITLALLAVGATAAYQAFIRSAQGRRTIGLGLGAISTLALAVALVVDLVVANYYIVAGQQWLAASITSSSSTCLAAVPAQLARIHSVEMSLRTIEFTAGLAFVICFLAMLAVDRSRARRPTPVGI